MFTEPLAVVLSKANREAYMTNGSGLFNSNSIYIPWWTPENRATNTPRLYFQETEGVSWVCKAGVVRLQDVHFRTHSKISG